MKTALTGLGTIGAALLAHVPCCGSTVLFAFGGASFSAGWLSVLEPYRWWFVGLSFVMLAVGFWQAYRKPHACHECGSCGGEAHARRRVKIGVMWGVAVMSLGLLVVGLMGDLGGGHDHEGHDPSVALHLH